MWHLSIWQSWATVSFQIEPRCSHSHLSIKSEENSSRENWKLFEGFWVDKIPILCLWMLKVSFFEWKVHFFRSHFEVTSPERWSLEGSNLRGSRQPFSRFENLFTFFTIVMLQLLLFYFCKCYCWGQALSTLSCPFRGLEIFLLCLLL